MISAFILPSTYMIAQDPVVRQAGGQDEQHLQGVPQHWDIFCEICLILNMKYCVATNREPQFYST
jgi:hypothetical protein